MTNIILDIVEKAKDIIADDRKMTIEKVFGIVEKFLAEAEIPVDSNYDPIDFYRYNAYPMFNYQAYPNNLKNTLIADNPELRIMYFIYNYIYNLNYGNYTVVNFVNIFWPHTNVKYRYLTYTAPARLDKSIQMKYLHPKYSLEEVYRRMYCPEYFEELEDLHVRKNQLLQLWGTLSESPETNDEPINPNFNKLQKSFIESVGKLFIQANYDDQIPIFIGDKASVDRAKVVLGQKFKNLTVIENSSKSFFDPRTINYMFKLDKMILGKVWVLLDNEVIPILSFDNTRAHISVCIKLALTEHITYEILGINDIAANKLKLYSQLLNTEKALKKRGSYTKINNCKFVGRYYPLDKYLSTKRTDELVKKLHEK